VSDTAPSLTRHCLTLDLADDPALIAEYSEHHRAVWPEVMESLRRSGIEHAEIHLFGTRMVMIIDVRPDFSFEAKAAADAANDVVQRWEALMWTFQRALPGTPPGEKWRRMERIWEFSARQ
jgi:L-rhamnose mutarotase